MRLDKTKAFFSIIYSLGQITLGFLVHPYQTMQMVVKDKIFSWMVVLPIGGLMAIIAVWRRLVVPFVRLFFSCSQTNFWGCDILPFLSRWLILYCVLWQILLLYLFVRFYFLYWVKKDQ